MQLKVVLFVPEVHADGPLSTISCSIQHQSSSAAAFSEQVREDTTKITALLLAEGNHAKFVRTFHQDHSASNSCCIAHIAAPLVISPKRFSAARPPQSMQISSIACSLLIRITLVILNLCMVKPRAPPVRGTMVIW